MRDKFKRRYEVQAKQQPIDRKKFLIGFFLTIIGTVLFFGVLIGVAILIKS